MEELWQKTVVAYCEVHPAVCLEGLSDVRKASVMIFYSGSRFEPGTTKNKKYRYKISVETHQFFIIK
jgi:hypothetical protein